MTDEPEEAEAKARREERMGQIAGDPVLEKQAVTKEVKARKRKRDDRRERAARRRSR
jgi:hypothetical protein